MVTPKRGCKLRRRMNPKTESLNNLNTRQADIIGPNTLITMWKQMPGGPRDPLPKKKPDKRAKARVVRS